MKRLFLVCAIVAFFTGTVFGSGPTVTYNFIQGLNAADLGNYNEALKYFSTEIEKHPGNGFAYAWRGKVNETLGNDTDAMADANRAVAKIPKKEKTYRAFTHNLRGRLFLKSGNASLAADEFSTATTLLPEVGESYALRAEALIAMNDYEGAINDLITAIGKGYVDTVPRAMRLLVGSAGNEKLETIPAYKTLLESLAGQK